MNHFASMNPSRRDFIQQAATIATGTTAVTGTALAGQTPTSQPLPTIRLDVHNVSRLIIGGNPMYGYSHFNRLLNQHQKWDVDYYMCCLYYLTRPREDYQKLLGPDLPLGEIYLPSDPPRMFKVIQGMRKPCLAYKVLAAGRRINSPAEIRSCFETAFANTKPTDAVIVGMNQQFNDQVGENAAMIREICAKRR